MISWYTMLKVRRRRGGVVVIDPVGRAQIDASLVMGKLMFSVVGGWNIKQSRDCGFCENISYSLSEVTSFEMFFPLNSISVQFG